MHRKGLGDIFSKLTKDERRHVAWLIDRDDMPINLLPFVPLDRIMHNFCVDPKCLCSPIKKKINDLLLIKESGADHAK